ncbi:lysin B [Gordonia phage Margaret]|nr:lysin B [Gordonia phage Margaret]
MPTTYVVGLRGTGEPDYQPKPSVPTPMLRHIAILAEAGRLRSSDNHVVYVEVPYPASIGFVNARRDVFGSSLYASLLAGAQALSDTIKKVRARMMQGDKLIVAGYSLGCLVVLHTYNHLRSSLAGVDRFILIASPATSSLRPNVTARTSGRGKRFTGIASEWVTDEWMAGDSRAYSLAHPLDPIAFLHPSSPLRYAVPALWELDLDDPKALDAAIRMVQTGKVAGIITRLIDPDYREAAATAIDDIIRYTHGGYHTARYELDSKVIDRRYSVLTYAAQLVREAQ